MPHIRKDNYPTVDTDKYKLEFVEIVHRHHKRTPYASNCYPKENLVLYCDDSVNNYYSEFRAGTNDTLKISWENYQNQNNPFSFVDNGYNGTCQFPQISFDGLEDSFQHGSDLYQVYSELGFLPDEYNSETIKFRVTNNVITSQVASALIKAMYPEEDSIDVQIEIDSMDALEPAYTCEFASDVYAGIRATEEWNDHLDRASDLYDRLDSMSGVSPTSSGWHVSFDHYFDNTAFRTCHGYDLACNIDNSTDCMSQEDAEQITRLGDWEYNYMWRMNENSTLYAATHYGAYFSELRERLSEKVTGSSKLKYSHNVAHDGSLSSILSFLQIDYLRWPGMGAEISFELYYGKEDSTWYLRILYLGKVLDTTGPLGSVDMIKLDDFISYINSMIGSNNEILIDYCINN
ncbi:hypothetical protein CANARDRAFT_201928 [[Candida] arabinofermentans NRRL YB-2248]|uniref:Acid phosphatase n=1 Tax=[Candida] arabinofermentans NRRL YB-2248 TaxID=983967 RepID=A0A1E4SX81_9ASCO|nr:hypothetical protein CANARDRAFT_201928 [[Candida] arabinofermentans NRRL YB-2248]